MVNVLWMVKVPMLSSQFLIRMLKCKNLSWYKIATHSLTHSLTPLLEPPPGIEIWGWGSGTKYNSFWYNLIPPCQSSPDSNWLQCLCLCQYTCSILDCVVRTVCAALYICLLSESSNYKLGCLDIKVCYALTHSLTHALTKPTSRAPGFASNAGAKNDYDYYKIIWNNCYIIEI